MKMKKRVILSVVTLALVMLCACAGTDDKPAQPVGTQETYDQTDDQTDGSEAEAFSEAVEE